MVDKERLVELAESVDLERRADLMAAACQFGEASRLMGHANTIRRRHFGWGYGPNELRELCAAALRSLSTPSMQDVDDDD